METPEMYFTLNEMYFTLNEGRKTYNTDKKTLLWLLFTSVTDTQSFRFNQELQDV